MESNSLRDSQLLNQLTYASHSSAETNKSLNHRHNHLRAKKKKKKQSPTGFGCKHVLRLLPQLRKSHSSASKPSCARLKACLVKLCRLFVILTAGSSLDFNSECPSKRTKAEQPTAGSNGGKTVPLCPPPPAPLQKKSERQLFKPKES